MLTVDKLRAFGADVDDGLKRCMNNEAFYLRLVNMALDDPGVAHLQEAAEDGDRKAAFEAAHALKGMLANLSLSPLAEPAAELTELLRAEGEGIPDACADYVRRIAEAKDRLLALRDGE